MNVQEEQGPEVTCGLASTHGTLGPFSAHPLSQVAQVSHQRLGLLKHCFGGYIGLSTQNALSESTRPTQQAKLFLFSFGKHLRAISNTSANIRASVDAVLSLDPGVPCDLGWLFLPAV